MLFAIDVCGSMVHGEQLSGVLLGCGVSIGNTFVCVRFLVVGNTQNVDGEVGMLEC